MSEWKETNREAAGIVKSAARAPRRSGKLASTVRTGATQKAGIVRAGKKAVPYAGPIHWGWPTRNIKAQPFLTDAAKKTEPVWVPLYFKRIEKLIGEVKGI